MVFGNELETEDKTEHVVEFCHSAKEPVAANAISTIPT